MHPDLVRGTRTALGTVALVAGPALLGAQAAPAPQSQPQPSQKGTVELGVFGQYNTLPSGTDFTSTSPTTVGGRLHLGLGGGLGLELEGSSAGVSRAARPGLADTDARYTQLAARVVFTTQPFFRGAAFVLGAGTVRSDYEYTFRYGASGLGGVRIPVGQRFALRGDAIVNLLPSSGETELGYRLGLHTILGPYAGSTAADRATGNRTATEAGAIELGGFLGVVRHAYDWNVQPSGIGGGRVGVSLTSRSQVELEFGLAIPDIEDEALTASTARPRNGTDYNYVPLTLRYNYNVPLGKSHGAIVGLGVTRADYGWTHNWGPSGLVGYRIPVWNGVQLRGDLAATWLPSANATDLSARLGASWVLKGL